MKDSAYSSRTYRLLDVQLSNFNCDKLFIISHSFLSFISDLYKKTNISVMHVPTHSEQSLSSSSDSLSILLSSTTAILGFLLYNSLNTVFIQGIKKQSIYSIFLKPFVFPFNYTFLFIKKGEESKKRKEKSWICRESKQLNNRIKTYYLSTNQLLIFVGQNYYLNNTGLFTNSQCNKSFFFLLRFFFRNI